MLQALGTREVVSEIRQVTVEQSGPVRAVVKFDGVHKATKGSREWLPFHVRLYFYAGQQPARMVHTIVFDGDEHRDFIRGLGVVLRYPCGRRSRTGTSVFPERTAGYGPSRSSP